LYDDKVKQNAYKKRDKKLLNFREWLMARMARMAGKR
jgi:hypothetical protein